jgi:hypothetical protein
MCETIIIEAPNINYFNKTDDFEQQCLSFIKDYGKCIHLDETSNDETNADVDSNDVNSNDDIPNETSNDVNSNDEISNDVNSNDDIPNDVNSNDDIPNDIINSPIIPNHNSYVNSLNNHYVPYNHSHDKFQGAAKSFISFKMEITVNILFKILIFLMITCIIIIIVLLFHISLEPLRTYKLPLDYHYYTIQPPRHNVKKWDINNKNNGIISSLKEINNNLNRDKNVHKSNAEQIKDEVKEMIDNRETFFSENYNFGI